MFSILLRTWIKGEWVATDPFGNRYYRRKSYKGPWQQEPRWVIYKGAAEASKVPALFYSWLHHTSQFPSTLKNKSYAWEKSHRPHLTGTKHAFKPHQAPSIQLKTPLYTAWRPQKFVSPVKKHTIES